MVDPRLTEKLPDTAEACQAMMIQLDTEIAKIRKQITEEAAVQYKARGMNWLAKTQFALRKKCQLRTLLQNEAARLRKLEKQAIHEAENQTFERTFIMVASEFLQDEEYDSIVNEVFRRRPELRKGGAK